MENLIKKICCKFNKKEIFKDKVELKNLSKHKTKRHSLYKFLGLIGIVVFYFIFISIKLGTQDGVFVTILTWSFFIFCTPIADAGFLLAFPVRILMGIRMMYTQLFSFVLAFFISIYTFFFTPEIYSKTVILTLFHDILSKPFPFWGIIILSLIGTIYSIYFGDEMIDVSSNKQRKKYHKHLNSYQIVVSVFVISITITLYYLLLKQLGVSIPL